MAQRVGRDFVEDVLTHVSLPEPIVEFGSLQVEEDQDGDLRPLFAGRVIVGTDMRPGPGVDRVEDLRALTFGDGEVGTAVCLDTLEHCADPPLAVREMHRVLRPDGGVCLISSVMRFPIHDYPQDLFRFTPDGFGAMLEPFDDAQVCGLGHPEFPQQVFGVGIRGGRLDGLGLGEHQRLGGHQRIYERAPLGLRIGHELVPPRELARMVGADARRYLAARRALRRVRRDERRSASRAQTAIGE